MTMKFKTWSDAEVEIEAQRSFDILREMDRGTVVEKTDVRDEHERRLAALQTECRRRRLAQPYIGGGGGGG